MKKLKLKRKNRMQDQQDTQRARVGQGILDNPTHEMRVRVSPDQTELFVYAVKDGELVAYSCTTSERELRADRQEFEADFFPEQAELREIARVWEV